MRVFCRWSGSQLVPLSCLTRLAHRAQGLSSLWNVDTPLARQRLQESLSTWRVQEDRRQNTRIYTDLLSAVPGALAARKNASPFRLKFCSMEALH